jgi:L-fucose isomerase-like protein
VKPLQNSHNAFSKHLIEHHPNQPGEFTVNVVQSYKNPLERQVAEGVKIINMESDIQMNSRLDHFQPAIGRIIINNQLQ